MPYHFTTQHKPGQNTRKLETNFQCSHQKNGPPFAPQWQEQAGARRPPELQLSKRGDEWRGMHTLKPILVDAAEGVDFRSRRRHRCLRFSVLQIIGQRSQLDSMRSQFLWDMSDMANAPRQVVRAKENKENILEELHTGPWGTELLRACTQGSLVPLRPSANDLNKLQRCLSQDIEWRTVRNLNSTQNLSCVMCIKQFSALTKAVHGTASNTSAAGLQVLRSCLGCRDLSTKRRNGKHNLEEKFWHLAFTTWTVAPLRRARLGWLLRQAHLPLHGAWRWTWQIWLWTWDVKSTIDKQSFPDTNLNRLGKAGEYLQLRSFTFFHSTVSI